MAKIKVFKYLPISSSILKQIITSTKVFVGRFTINKKWNCKREINPQDEKIKK